MSQEPVRIAAPDTYLSVTGRCFFHCAHLRTQGRGMREVRPDCYGRDIACVRACGGDFLLGSLLTMLGLTLVVVSHTEHDRHHRCR